ncbi:MAG: hypothetical protein DI551_04285 [Micavibrio aeruginosavorus]|uniref:Uncharacterized protein n=1 Tax=Micavibrio aeruginosavorus TaxID=349221 RepID=A0A2W5N1H1_9BACT|nr:MAG: hypothetical protein DI551_04285 [Micavibrio aeruginosavorus]
MVRNALDKIVNWFSPELSCADCERKLEVCEYEGAYCPHCMINGAPEKAKPQLVAASQNVPVAVGVATATAAIAVVVVPLFL